MKSKKMNRRSFINTTAAAGAAFTIVPSSVISGLGHIPPSDQISIANIGCGTQGLREMGIMLQNPRLRVTSICDPNKYTTDYIDWSPFGLKMNIRNVLGDNSWWEGVNGIPGGRDVMKAYVDAFYKKEKADYSGVASYEDYRELLEKEKVDVVKIMTPDHLHAPIALAAMSKGVNVVTHKPIANRMKEGLKVIEETQKSGVVTHLLAWSDRPEYDLILKWIRDGVIGELKEIHNWSSRPVWQQWTENPTEEVPIPKDFNWDLWLGPVPDRAYHPNYTHNVFRGWYDFGGGSIADMGHYSLFPLFEKFGINKPPTSAKAYGTTTRKAVNNVYQWVNNDVAFPLSCMIQLKFPDQGEFGPFDLYWYDGGMKPFAPEELEADGQDVEMEGMMFVGDKGKILGGFRGENPRIIPKAKMDAYDGQKKVEVDEGDRYGTFWADYVAEGKESPGSFVRAKCITETINLAAIALRTRRKVEYDSEAVKITNVRRANKFLTREYREGWEI